MDILESDDSGSEFDDSNDFEFSDNDYESDNESYNIVIQNSEPQHATHVFWSQPKDPFTSRFTIPDDRKPEVLVDLEAGCTEVECFQNIFPRSLYIFISQCTNERLQILRDKKKKKMNQKSKILTPVK